MSHSDIWKEVIALKNRVIKLEGERLPPSAFWYDSPVKFVKECLTEDHHKVIKQRTKDDWSRVVTPYPRRSERSVEFRLARWNAFDPDEDEISRELRLCWGRRSDDNPSVK
jgi:hypothetical protein